MEVIREAKTGEAVSCAVSLDGVPLRPDGDEEAYWASSGTVSGADGTRLKTLSFGPETGKTTVPLAAEIAHVRKVRARRWSPSPRPTTGRLSESSGPTSRQSISFTPANVSAKLPSMRWRPTGTTNIASLCATHGVDKVGDTPSPRQGDDESGDRGA